MTHDAVETPASQKPAARPPMPPRLYLPAIIVIAVIAGLGYGVYRHESEEVRQRAQASLVDIGRLKAEQIGSWLRERRGDTSMAQANTCIRQIVHAPADPAARAEALGYFEALRRTYGYDEVAVFDAEARPLLVSAEGGVLSPHACAAEHVRAARSAGGVILADLHRGAPGEPIHLDLWAPLPSDTRGPAAVLMLSVDPYDYLYSRLQRWPTPSETAETVLLRREGDDVVVLNELRHRKDAALHLRMPASRSSLPMVRASVFGERGLLPGVDHRDVPVLAAAFAVPDSHWVLVAKVDRAEIEASLRWEGAIIAVLCVFAALAAVLGSVVLWRRHALQVAQRTVAAQAAAEAALRRSEARARAMLDAIPDLMFRISRDGVFLDYRADEEELYVPPHAFVGKPVRDVMPPAFTALLESTIRDTLASHTLQTFEYALSMPDERGVRHYEARLVASGPDEVTAIVRNISERRRAEERLRVSEERFRAIFESSADGILLADPATRRFKLANPAMARMLGYRAEEIASLGLADLHPPDFLPFAVGHFDAHPEAAMQVRNVPLRRRDGSIFFADVVSNVVTIEGSTCYAGFFRDTTERKLAEEALRQRETQLSEALRMARAGRWEYDVAADRFTFNDNFYRVFGTTAEAEGGYQMSAAEYARRFCHPEDAPMVAKEIAAALATDDSGYNRQIDHRILRADGSVGDLSVRLFVVKDVQGRTIRIYGVNQDITERRRSEQVIRDAQKMEGIGRLAGGVAHDFNNILAATLMEVSLLREEPDLPDALREGLGNLESYANRAAALTRQLLLFSRRSVMQKVPLDLDDVVTDLLKMLRRILGEDIIVETRLWGALPMVAADPGMMEQVVMNLSVNARDAMEKGGHLRYETGVTTISEAEAAANPRRRAGTFAYLAVSDTGCGMDEATLSRIFEPFFTTKKLGKGTGLGLATVYGIVEQHAGFVEVESRVGQGSTFRVYLPAKPEAAAQGGEAGGPESIAGGHESVLLVEDEASVRRSTAAFLRRVGYRVIEASNGPEALGIFEKRSAEIDLLFTDMVMPEGLSGLDLTQRLRASRPGLPVIISSGYSADLINRGDLGAVDIVFVPKPSGWRELAAAMRRCLDRPA